MSINMLKGEHIIYDNKGNPIFSNKTREEQNKDEDRGTHIPFIIGVERAYINMMEKEYGQRQS